MLSTIERNTSRAQWVNKVVLLFYVQIFDCQLYFCKIHLGSSCLTSINKGPVKFNNTVGENSSCIFENYMSELFHFISLSLFRPMYSVSDWKSYFITSTQDRAK